MITPCLRGLAGLALVFTMGTIGTVGAVGCHSQPMPATSSAAPQKALPLGVYPASPIMTREHGIVEWRSFAGRTQVVVTGYRADGHPALGIQFAWFKAVPGALGHIRIMMLDGSGATVRRMTNGKKTGTLSVPQMELYSTMRYDMMRALSQGAAPTKSASLGSGSIRALDFVRPSDGIHTLDSPGTGPQCTAAWANPAIPLHLSECGLGVLTFEDGEGAVQAAFTCTEWYTETEEAQNTCKEEDEESCDTNGQCNYGGGSPEAAAPAMPTPGCDHQCLCANYDTEPGCNMNIGPCSYNSDCYNGYTCQPAAPGWSSKTCQPPPEAGAPEAGASDDGGGADGSTGEDGGGGDGPVGDGGGDDGSVGDDGGAAGDDGGSAGDDGGSVGDDGGSDLGDDGGSSDPNAPPTDQQLDGASADPSCPSCQSPGSDLSVNPQNGGVSVAPTDPNQAAGPPGDPTDVGGSSSSSSSGSAGSSQDMDMATQDSSSQDPGSQDTATQDASQDTATQDSQDTASQDTATQDSQDTASQDTASQDTASQDAASQDAASQDTQDTSQDSAIRRHHTRRVSAWQRIYDWIAH